MAWHFGVGLFAALLFGTIAPVVAAEGQRLALVVGNGAYSSALDSPPRDADAMESTLTGLRFSVTSRKDRTRDEMINLVKDFSKSVGEAVKRDGSAVAFFYFSGHGMEVDGKNYLVPVNAVIQDETDVKTKAVELNLVITLLRQTRANPVLIVLDACRDNPFEKAWKGETGGLAKVNAPPGMLIAYAAAPGRKAPQSISGLSPYTAELVAVLQASTDPVVQTFRTVQNNVYKKSSPEKLQEPYLELPPGISDEFRFDRLGPAPPSKIFRDCAECPEMVVVPAGSFNMGTPPDEPQRNVYEGLPFPITIARPFAVGKYEVTFEDWDACVAADGCQHKPDDKGWGRGRRPVINVNWNNAQEYVAWLSKRTGKRYQLLTEAEWEYAARAGTTARYSWGDEPGTNRANFEHSGSPWSGTQTAPVGSFDANRFGLHDMIGNVWEWVQDCSELRHLRMPADGRALEEAGCLDRVIRGGFWGSSPEWARASFARASEPRTRSYAIGFRVRRDASIQ